MSDVLVFGVVIPLVSFLVGLFVGRHTSGDST